MSPTGATTGRSRIDSVAVGIPSWNGRRHLEACLASLAQQTDPGVQWQAVVFDNASTDGTADWLARQHPSVRVLRSERNVGFAAACNGVAEASDADAVALLNNDTRPRRGWLRALVGQLADSPPDVIAVGGKVVDWEGKHLDFASGILTFDGYAFQANFGRPLESIDVPAAGAELLFASGSNMLVRRPEFLALGGFDADYFAYPEDVDFGWRAWSAGYRIGFAAEAVVGHRGAATSDRLGNARRGFLIERNAFMTAYKNYDAETWPKVMPAILTTLISRAMGCLADEGGSHRWLLEDPLEDDALASSARPGLLGRLLTASDGRPKLCAGARTEAQLRALGHIVRDLDRYADRRKATQALRMRGDAEILTAFPPHVIPTYPGDHALFGSSAFSQWLPQSVPFVYSTLAEIMGHR